MRRVIQYFVIAAGGVGSIAMVASTPRFDLLIFLSLMTYLIVSLLAPAQRHRRRPPSPASPGLPVSGVCRRPGLSSPSSRLRQNAATVG